MLYIVYEHFFRKPGVFKMKQAMFWKKSGNNIACGLCAHRCKIPKNGVGFCRVRKNVDSVLYSLVFGKPCSVAVDPIEKKPLFHFAPGSKTLSIATVGCNFRCKFCQNWEISQPEEVEGEDVAPEQLKEMVGEYPGFSWTYTEPTVFYEYFYETAKITKGKYHIWVSNGYTNPGPIEKAKINAVNVDYKGDETVYHGLCSTHLEPVHKALKTYKKLGVWIEITNLLIPGHNDKDEQIREMVSWIASLGKDVPLHFSRFFPCYKLKADITSLESLERAAKIAEEELNYVYIGNVQHEKGNTICPNCGHLLIKRDSYTVSGMDLVKKGKDYCCPECTEKIPLAGMQWSPWAERIKSISTK